MYGFARARRVEVCRGIFPDEPLYMSSYYLSTYLITNYVLLAWHERTFEVVLTSRNHWRMGFDSSHQQVISLLIPIWHLVPPKPLGSVLLKLEKYISYLYGLWRPGRLLGSVDFYLPAEQLRSSCRSLTIFKLLLYWRYYPKPQGFGVSPTTCTLLWEK